MKKIRLSKCGVRDCVLPPVKGSLHCTRHQALLAAQAHQNNILPGTLHDKAIYRDYIQIPILFAHNGIIRRDMYKWHTVKSSIGHIAGLPASFGKLLATNGIDIFIERINQSPYIGPGFDQWIVDVDLNAESKQKKRSVRKSLINLYV